MSENKQPQCYFCQRLIENGTKRVLWVCGECPESVAWQEIWQMHNQQVAPPPPDQKPDAR